MDLKINEVLCKSVPKLASLYMAYKYYDNSYNAQNGLKAKLSKTELELANELNDKEIKEERKKFIAIVGDQIKNHIMQINSDLLAMSRECERDMHDQINQHVLSMVLATTLILGSVIAFIIQANLSDGCSDDMKWLYSFFSTFSVICIVVSIVLYELVGKYSTRFMYVKSKAIYKAIADAILKFKMNPENEWSTPKSLRTNREIRKNKIKSPIPSRSASNESNQSDISDSNNSVNSVNSVNNKLNNPSPALQSQIDRDNEVRQNLYRRRDHFEELFGKLVDISVKQKENNTLNHNSNNNNNVGSGGSPRQKHMNSPNNIYSNNNNNNNNSNNSNSNTIKHSDIQSFYKFMNFGDDSLKVPSMRVISDVATDCFYVGTAAFIVSIALYDHSYFYVAYKSLASLYISYITLVLSIVLAFLIKKYCLKCEYDSNNRITRFYFENRQDIITRLYPEDTVSNK